MQKKKNQESFQKNNPTPWLGLPRPDRKIFSYSENALLDQITTEIMHAWEKDLRTIKTHFKMLTEASLTIRCITDLMDKKLPALENFLTSEHFILVHKETKANMEKIDLYFAETNKRLFELENRIQFPYVKELRATIKSLSEKVDLILKQNNKKTFWSKIFERKQKIKIP